MRLQGVTSDLWWMDLWQQNITICYQGQILSDVGWAHCKRNSIWEDYNEFSLEPCKYWKSQIWRTSPGVWFSSFGPSNEHLSSSHVRPDKRPRYLINKHISMCTDSATLYNVVINDIFMWVTCGGDVLGRRKQLNREVCSPVSASQPASVKIITIEWWLSGCRAGPDARCLAACGWSDLNKFLLLWAKTIWWTPDLTEDWPWPPIHLSFCQVHYCSAASWREFTSLLWSLKCSGGLGLNVNAKCNLLQSVLHVCTTLQHHTTACFKGQK